jgi:hypothetical protein
MRPHKPQRSLWVQFGIGAAALLLPPLALGAALYSMLTGPDEDLNRPTQAVQPQPVAAAAPQQPTDQPPPGKFADDATRLPERGIVAPSAPVQVAMTPPGAQDAAAVAPPPADPPAPTPPKRPVTRRVAKTQDLFPLKNWLQQFGNLLRNPHGS